MVIIAVYRLLNVMNSFCYALNVIHVENDFDPFLDVLEAFMKQNTFGFCLKVLIKGNYFWVFKANHEKKIFLIFNFVFFSI